NERSGAEGSSGECGVLRSPAAGADMQILIPTQPSPTHPTVKTPQSLTAQGLERGRMADRIPLGFNGMGYLQQQHHRPADVQVASPGTCTPRVPKTGAGR